MFKSTLQLVQNLIIADVSPAHTSTDSNNNIESRRRQEHISDGENSNNNVPLDNGNPKDANIKIRTGASSATDGLRLYGSSVARPTKTNSNTTNKPLEASVGSGRSYHRHRQLKAARSSSATASSSSSSVVASSAARAAGAGKAVLFVQWAKLGNILTSTATLKSFLGLATDGSPSDNMNSNIITAHNNHNNESGELDDSCSLSFAPPKCSIVRSLGNFITYYQSQNQNRQQQPQLALLLLEVILLLLLLKACGFEWAELV